MSLEIRKTVRDMRTQKWQFITLIIIAICGTTFLFGMGTHGTNQKQSLLDSYDRLSITSYNLLFESQWISNENASQVISHFDHIEGKEYRINYPILVNLTNHLENYLVTPGLAFGVNLSNGRELTVNKLYLDKGNNLSKTNSNYSILLEKDYAESHGLLPGNNVSIIINGKNHELIIAGLVTSPEFFIVCRKGDNAFSSARKYGIVYFNLETLQSILLSPSGINEISIRLEKDFESETNKIATEMKIEFENSGNYILSVTNRENLPSHKRLWNNIENDQGLVLTIPYMMFFVGSFGMYISISRLIKNQRRQIGILLSMGYPRRNIILNYTGIALIIGIIGGIFGIIFGHIFTITFGVWEAKEMGVPFYNPQFQPQFIIPTFFCEIFILILGALIPTLSVLRSNLNETIYKDPNLSIQSLSSFSERLFSRIHKLSLWVIISLRNILRNRTRTISTILVIALCVGLSTSTLEVIGTYKKASNFNYYTWDYRFFFREFQSKNTVHNYFSNVEGVKKVDCILHQTIYLECDNDNHSYNLLGMDLPSSSFNVNYEKGTQSELSITWGLAHKLALSIGDQVHITVFRNNSNGWVKTLVKSKISGIIDSIPYNSFFIVSKEYFETLTNISKSLVNTVYLVTEQDKDEAVSRSILKYPGVIDFDQLRLVKQDFKRVVDVYNEFYDIFVFVIILLMVAIVANTISINANERTRESAIYSSMGIQTRYVILPLCLENMMYSLIGIVIGYFIGYLLGFQMTEALISGQLEGMTLIYSLNIINFLYISLLTFITVFITELISIRYYRNLNLPEILNQRIT